METAFEQFQARDAQVIAAAVQDQAGAQLMAGAIKASFPILADPDHQLAEAYGVYNRLGDGVATPAAFIIDKAGQLVWSYIGQNAGDRPGPAMILEHLPAQ